MSRGLDVVGAISPGSGRLDAYGYVNSDDAGGALDYAHRITDGLSVFARGWGGGRRDGAGLWRTDYGAQGGLRWQW